MLILIRRTVIVNCFCQSDSSYFLYLLLKPDFLFSHIYVCLTLFWSKINITISLRVEMQPTCNVSTIHIRWSKKASHKVSQLHNFTKYWPIFQILSVECSEEICNVKRSTLWYLNRFATLQCPVNSKMTVSCKLKVWGVVGLQIYAGRILEIGQSLLELWETISGFLCSTPGYDMYIRSN